MEPDTTFVSGITGQIGSYLAESYLNDGCKVIGLKRRSSIDTLQNIEHLLENKNLILEKGDMTDISSLIAIITKYKPTRIINCAAMSHVSVSFKEPIHSLEVTGKGVLNLLEAVRTVNNYYPHIVQFSTSELYADQLSVVNGEQVQNELTPMIPNSPYAIAKLAGYHYIRLYREAYGMFAANAIIFNTESERRSEDFVTRKISLWIGRFKAWLEDKDIRSLSFDGDYIYFSSGMGCGDTPRFPKLRLGNIESFRDWNYVGDTVRAVKLILDHYTPDDFVVSSGHTHSIKEFLSSAFFLAGINDWTPYVVIDQNLFRPREVPYLRGDSTKIRETLGWSPETSFEELVRIMVDHDIQAAKKS